MARKSRKGQIQSAGQTVERFNTASEQSTLAKRYTTAIYARLSVENGGKQDGGNSLRNQIDVCKAYISDCPYLKLTEIYSDNGQTGTVFDRPAWNQLMEDIRAGKIEAVVVRDLSRFGRDYLEAGNYLERIFPALGVRFISVKENFDNFTCDGSAESLAVPLQNLINALYSKDISRKVSTALLAQQKNGTFRNRNVPYGYIWNEEKTAYAIDDEAAGHLKDIFRWKLEGVSVYQIVERLEKAGVPNPEQRKRENGTRRGNGAGKGWANSTICRILTNQAYLGHTVHGKEIQALYKGQKRERTSPEQWIVYPNTHPALVSQEDFQAVQTMLKQASMVRQEKMKASASVRSGMVDLFDGKLFCANCGKRFYYRRHKVDKVVPETWMGSYNCSTYARRRSQESCTNHYIRQNKLNETVFTAVQDQLKIALDCQKLLAVLKGSSGEANLKEKYHAAVTSIRLKRNAISQKQEQLYENYVDGILNEEEYAFAKQTYEKDYQRLTQLMEEAIQRRERFLESISQDNRWMNMMKTVKGMEELTQELIDTLIEKIYIYENGAVEIVFHYDDVYQDMCRSVQEMQEEETLGVSGKAGRTEKIEGMEAEQIENTEGKGAAVL